MNMENQWAIVDQDEIIGTSIECVNTQRKVMTYKWEKVKNESFCETVEDGVGDFIEYGVNFEESEFGPGNFTTAIVEMPDGSVKNIPVNLIKFLDVEKN